MIAQTKPNRLSLFPGAGAGVLGQRRRLVPEQTLERLQFAAIKASWRYRYFLAFMVFGFLSILLEVALVQWALPASWPIRVNLTIGFV